MLRGLRQHYIDPIRGFGRPARLFLAMLVLDGVIFSSWQLFFNFYILQSGFTREFLGLATSLPSAAALIFGIPLGRLSDRIGRKASIIIGIAMSSLLMLAQITLRDPRLIAAAAFLYGGFNILFVVAQAPLMAKLSNRDNRTLLFSLGFGLQTIAGSVGALFAGQLPGLFAGLLSVGAHSAAAYQAVLIASVLLGSVGILPMWLMDEPRPTPGRSAAESVLADRGLAHPTVPRREAASSLWIATARLTAPQVLIGFGAAILIPYINVFYKDRFNIGDSTLGGLFGLSSLLIGVGSLLAPRLATMLSSKIRAIVVTQSSSILFLLLLGFSPALWLSSLSYLMRTALMNMAAPLYSAYCMEHTPEEHQGLVNSVLGLAWSVGWAVGPYVSGRVQQQYGFPPHFVATAVLYGLASLLIWLLFGRSESAVAESQATLHSPEYPE